MNLVSEAQFHEDPFLGVGTDGSGPAWRPAIYPLDSPYARNASACRSRPVSCMRGLHRNAPALSGTAY